MPYSNMDIIIHLKNTALLSKNDINIANFEAVFSLENQSPLKDKKPFVLKADAKNIRRI